MFETIANEPLIFFGLGISFTYIMIFIISIFLDRKVNKEKK